MEAHTILSNFLMYKTEIRVPISKASGGWGLRRQNCQVLGRGWFRMLTQHILVMFSRSYNVYQRQLEFWIFCFFKKQETSFFFQRRKGRAFYLPACFWPQNKNYSTSHSLGQVTWEKPSRTATWMLRVETVHHGKSSRVQKSTSPHHTPPQLPNQGSM